MMASKRRESFFIVTYRDTKDNTVKTLKARSIKDSTLGLSFIAISDFVFETQGLLVSPAEEALKSRFENVRHFHLSIYSIISIEEAGNKGLAFKTNKAKLMVLPVNAKE